MSRTAPVESASSPSDGTKVHANASKRPTCDYERTAREIRADAGAVDAEDDDRVRRSALR
jgi:hypothetical protein